MKKNILLISEKTLKEMSTLNDGTFGKYILPAIREAQNIGLRRVIGDCLLDTLTDMVADGSIHADENVAYKDFLDNYVADFLIFQTQYELIPYLNIKLANIGVVVSNDEHVHTLSHADLELARNEYRSKADFAASRIRGYIRSNHDLLGMDSCTCAKLIDVASTNLWLGGIAGK